MARAHGQVFQVRDLEGTPALVAVQSLRGAGEPLRELILHGATGRRAELEGEASWKLSHSGSSPGWPGLLAVQVTCGDAPLARGLGPRPDGSPLGGSVGNLERLTPAGAACVLVAGRRFIRTQERTRLAGRIFFGGEGCVVVLII